MDEQKKPESQDQAQASEPPAHKPLTAEEVMAATVPLHVGIDRVNAERERAAREANAQPTADEIASKEDIHALIDAGKDPRVGTAFDPNATGVAVASGNAPNLIEGTGSVGTVENVQDGSGASSAKPEVRFTTEVVNYFPEELAAHILALNENGLVQLNNLPQTMDPQARQMWFAISEVADYVPSPAKDFVAANTQPGKPDAVWNCCRAVVEGKATGHSIAGTLAVPAQEFEVLGNRFNCATVAGVLGYLKAPHGG